MKAALALALLALSGAPGLTTVAGTGKQGDTGDGGPAAKAEISHPRGIAFLADGSYVFAEPYANRVRRVAPDGTISTVVGTGAAGYDGDGGPAKKAEVNFVHGVAPMPDGGFVVADMLDDRIRRVWPDGHISTVAGTGSGGFAGDGGPATKAHIDVPRGVTALPDGELLIPDTRNNRVRRVWRDGTITTVAGTGARGSGGDGGPATKATLNRPFSVSPLPDGGFLVAEAQGDHVRRVWPDGHISTVAGSGQEGFTGDGGAATNAELNAPHSVVALAGGGFLVADEGNNRVRRVWPDGRITTVVGTGKAGFSGDGGSPAQAQLDAPKALALFPRGGGFLLGDALNNRIRRVRMDIRAPLILCPLPRTLAPTALRCTLAEPAVVTLTLSREGRRVVQLTVQAKRGTTRLAYSAPLLPGSYTVRLAGRTADGRTAALRGTVPVR